MNDKQRALLATQEKLVVSVEQLSQVVTILEKLVNRIHQQLQALPETEAETDSGSVHLHTNKGSLIH